MAWGQRPVSTWNLFNCYLAWKWGSFTQDKNPQIWLEAEPPASVTGSRIILHWGWSPSWTRLWDPECLWAGPWACASLCVHLPTLAALFLSFSPLSPSLPLRPSISSEFSFHVLLYKFCHLCVEWIFYTHLHGWTHTSCQLLMVYERDCTKNALAPLIPTRKV